MTAQESESFVQAEAARLYTHWVSKDRRFVYSGDGYKITETVDCSDGAVNTMTETIGRNRELDRRVAWTTNGTPWTAPGGQIDERGRRVCHLYTEEQRQSYNRRTLEARAQTRAMAGIDAADDVSSSDDSMNPRG